MLNTDDTNAGDMGTQLIDCVLLLLMGGWTDGGTDRLAGRQAGIWQKISTLRKKYAVFFFPCNKPSPQIDVNFSGKKVDSLLE